MADIKRKTSVLDSLKADWINNMDLKLLMALATLIARTYSSPPTSPKFVPVFVSSDALNRIDDKESQSGSQLHDELSNAQGSSTQNGDYDIRKETQAIFNTPAPVYEHPQDHDDSGHHSHQVQPQYDVNQPIQQQHYQQPYQMVQQPAQMQPQYQINQQPGQIQQPYQIIQQPGQIPQSYQIVSQPGQNMQPYQQPGQIQQPILLAQQGLVNQQPTYPNQQQFLTGQQPLQANQQPLLVNQPPMLVNQQQLVPQPIQYQQPNQPMLISSPMGNQQIYTQPNGQQILLSQQTLPNQQAFVQQPNQNGQQILVPSSNVSPVNLGQPVNQVPNQGYIQQNGNVFAVVPLNNQNVPNQNSNTYLVPVQQMPNQVYPMNAGK